VKAVVCKQHGPPDRLVVEDVPPPVAGPGEVVVAVKAASVNFPDVLIIQNKYQVKPPLPFTPGSEMAGVVKAIGEGVRGFTPGARVMGITTYGAFAEEVAVEASRLVAIPDGMDFATASAFLLTYTTSDLALADRAALQPGERLLVLGASGGVGLAAVEIGRALGAFVIACASSEDKLALCRQHGADATINYTADDLRAKINELTGGVGVDVVYDAVGGDYSEPALRSLRWRGRFLVVGFAAGEIPKVPLNLVLLKGCAIVGVNVGGYLQREPDTFSSRLKQLGTWFSEGKLKPHVAVTMPLEKASDALASMAARQVQGKIVLLT
jgi:NADPH:quinone reductase